MYTCMNGKRGANRKIAAALNGSLSLVCSFFYCNCLIVDSNCLGSTNAHTLNFNNFDAPLFLWPTFSFIHASWPSNWYSTFVLHPFIHASDGLFPFIFFFFIKIEPGFSSVLLFTLKWHIFNILFVRLRDEYFFIYLFAPEVHR